MKTCGCPSGRVISNAERHAAWHALVVEQGGPVGAVTMASLTAARGLKTGTPSGETILDVRARASGKRASGALRRASY